MYREGKRIKKEQALYRRSRISQEEGEGGDRRGEERDEEYLPW
jgi:hypothetical protein